HQPRDSQTWPRLRGRTIHGQPSRSIHVRVQPPLRRRSQFHARRHHRAPRDDRSDGMKRGLVGAAVVFTAVLAMHAIGETQTSQSVGNPLPGITATEFSEFRLGLDDFTEVETAEEGLGPAYNGTSCAVCHNVPTIGGGGVILELRAGYRDSAGTHTGLNPAGDTLIHLLSTPAHACQVQMPDDVTVIARRAPIPLFGAGLVEAIPDEALLALQDPVDRDRDGVSGRAAIVVDVASGQRRVGRFGWKAQHATLLSFGADAYRNEMGITNELFSQELAVGVTADRMRVCDLIPDIEDKRDPRTGRRGIDNFASFMKLLAPVGRGPTGEAARIGEQMFHAMGC